MRQRVSGVDRSMKQEYTGGILTRTKSMVGKVFSSVLWVCRVGRVRVVGMVGKIFSSA